MLSLAAWKIARIQLVGLHAVLGRVVLRWHTSRRLRSAGTILGFIG